MPEQATHVTLPMELVGKIVQVINGLPYGQVAPLANELGQCIQQANAMAGKGDKPMNPDDMKDLKPVLQ